MYVILFIVFLVVAYFVTKNKKLMEDFSGMTAAKDYAAKASGLPSGVTPLEQLGKELGLTYTPLPKTGAKHEIQAAGGRLKGTYKDLPIEIIMESRAEEVPTMNIAVTYSYQYSNDCRVVLHVSNPTHKKFAIEPKLKEVTAKPTGNHEFDSKLQLVGDAHAVSHEMMSYAAHTGWMHLKLSGNELTFHDDYFEQPEFKTMSGGMKMMHATHPVWKTTPQHPAMKVENVTKLLDAMVSVAQGL